MRLKTKKHTFFRSFKWLIIMTVIIQGFFIILTCNYDSNLFIFLHNYYDISVLFFFWQNFNVLCHDGLHSNLQNYNFS